MKKLSLFVMISLFMCPGTDAQNSFLISADSLNTSVPFDGIFAAFDIINDIIYTIDGNTVQTIDLASGEPLQEYVLPDESYSGFPSFITLSTSGLDLWVGYTTFEASDDRIYTIDTRNGEWTQIATMPANFDLVIMDGYPLVSGLNSADWSASNGIWLLDQTGSNNHRLLINTGGYSAGLDTDTEGNVFYGSSFFSENALLKWSHADITSALSNADDTLTLEDAVRLVELPAGTYDIDFDASGTLVFNCNNFIENFIGKWNGIIGEGSNYDTLATTDLFLTKLAARGNVNLKEPINQVYAVAYGTTLAEIHYDIPPVISNPFADRSIPLGNPDPAEIDLYEVFHDDDDHDSIFVFSIQDNSNSALLSATVKEGKLLLEILGSTPGRAEISVSAAAHLYKVTDTLAVTVTYPLGTAGHPAEKAMIIYPNPSSEYLKIKTASNTSLSLEFLDMTGRKVLTRQDVIPGDIIDISPLASGSYLLKITSGEWDYQTIIIKQ